MHTLLSWVGQVLSVPVIMLCALFGTVGILKAILWFLGRR